MVPRTSGNNFQSILSGDHFQLGKTETYFRFDQINEDFQQLMKDMSKQSNVVIATNVSGLPEHLEAIQSKLSLCEKALAEYLETKRLAFPRFYFASSADLLDILSNSDYPLKVAKHLTKLFDSMAKLTMEEEGSKLAIAMTAKVLNSRDSTRNTIFEIIFLICAYARWAFLFAIQDGEHVPFSAACICKDQVEVWLNR